MSIKMITPPGRASYPQLVTPKSHSEGGEPQFSIVCMFDEETDLTELEGVIREVATEAFGAKAVNELKSGKLYSPIRTDGESKGYPKGSRFFSAKTKNRPGVVGSLAGEDGKPKPLDDVAKEIYAGCYIRASVAVFSFNRNGKRGVSIALNNVQKLGEGERIDGRMRAEDEFEAVETEPVAMAA